MKADVTKRINRAIGQLNGIKTMVEEGRYKPTNELSRPTTRETGTIDTPP